MGDDATAAESVDRTGDGVAAPASAGRGTEDDAAPDAAPPAGLPPAADPILPAPTLPPSPAAPPPLMPVPEPVGPGSANMPFFGDVPPRRGDAGDPRAGISRENRDAVPPADADPERTEAA
jgi:hypothetical protein